MREQRPQRRAFQEGRLAARRDDAVEDEHDQHGDKADAHGAEQRAGEPVGQADARADHLAQRQAQQRAEHDAGDEENADERGPVSRRRHLHRLGHERRQIGRGGEGDRRRRQIAGDGRQAAQQAGIEAEHDGGEQAKIDGGVERVHANRPGAFGGAGLRLVRDGGKEAGPYGLIRPAGRAACVRNAQIKVFPLVRLSI